MYRRPSVGSSTGNCTIQKLNLNPNLVSPKKMVVFLGVVLLAWERERMDERWDEGQRQKQRRMVWNQGPTMVIVEAGDTEQRRGGVNDDILPVGMMCKLFEVILAI